MAVPAAAGSFLRRNFGRMVSAVKDPAVLDKAKEFITGASGKPVQDLSTFADRGGNNAALAVEALVRSGANVSALFQPLGVLSTPELQAYKDSLMSLQRQQNDAVSRSNPGFADASFGDAIGNAVRIDRVARALGLSLDQLWDAIVVFNSVNEQDIEQAELVRGVAKIVR